MKTFSKIVLVILFVLLFLIGFFFTTDRIFYNHYIRQSKQIRAQQEHADTAVITEENLASVPESIARYLRYSGIAGKKRINAVRVTHSGSFRPGADKEFFSIHGEYYLTADKPSFYWYGKISMAPGLTVTACDSYYKGEGRMVIKLMSAFKITDDSSAVTDMSAFGRLITEMTMIPSFFLDTTRISWTSYDSTHAEFVVRDAGLETTGQFFCHADGSPEKIIVNRYYSRDDGSPTREKFTGKMKGSKNFGGLNLPEVFDGYWNFKEGDLHYVHFVIESAEWE
jgi:hypothetical protein